MKLNEIQATIQWMALAGVTMKWNDKYDMTYETMQHRENNGKFREQRKRKIIKKTCRNAQLRNKKNIKTRLSFGQDRPYHTLIGKITVRIARHWI